MRNARINTTEVVQPRWATMLVLGSMPLNPISERRKVRREHPLQAAVALSSKAASAQAEMHRQCSHLPQAPQRPVSRQLPIIPCRYQGPKDIVGRHLR